MKEPRNGFAPSYPMIRKFPVPRGQDRDWRSEVLCHLTGKLFPREHDTKRWSSSQSQVSPVTAGSSQQKRPTTFLTGFLLWICKRHVHREKGKMWMSCLTEPSELQSALPMKCLPVSGYKLNIVLMCVVQPIGAHTDICWARKKMYRFLQSTLWLKTYNVLLYCNLGPGILQLYVIRKIISRAFGSQFLKLISSQARLSLSGWILTNFVQ